MGCGCGQRYAPAKKQAKPASQHLSNKNRKVKPPYIKPKEPQTVLEAPIKASGS